jgi:pimeloyl-ACP methyl ester carboxylesterase
MVAMKGKAALYSGDDRFDTRDGLSLWYRVSGRGPALLVPSPGWGASVDMYMKSLIPLETKFLLIYFDTRGAGRSDAPPKDSGFAFSHFLDDLETLRKHLRLDRWLIFAHSDASVQAMAYAIDYPDACRGLFIVGGTPRIYDKEYDDDLAARKKKLRDKPWFAAAEKALNSDAKSDTEFRQSFIGVGLPMYFGRKRAADQARHYFSASTYRVIGNTYDNHAPQFPPTELAKIGVPTALFVGNRDVITTPLEARRLHSGIADSMLFTIKGAGHFPWLDQPDRFSKCFDQAAGTILRRRR